MANPYQRALLDVVNWKATVPDTETFHFLSGWLSGQEDKIEALNTGLIEALFDIHATAVKSPELAKSRVIIVEMLQKLCLLMEGRKRLFENVGVDRLLTLLADGSLQVRQAACDLLFSLAGFPDVSKYLHQERKVIQALYHVFNTDCASASMSALPAIGALSRVDPNMDARTMTKVVAFLRETAAMSGDRVAVQQTISLLKCLWNVTADFKEKELAIDVGVVPAVAPLLASANDEIRRLASGTLTAMSVPLRGKLALIALPETVALLCTLAVDAKTPKDLKANVILTIRNIAENPQGLLACGFHLTDTEFAIDILGPASVAQVISALLNDPKKLVLGLDALQPLLKDERGRLAAWDILEIVPRLKTLTTSSNVAVAGLSSRALEALVAHVPDAKLELERYEQKTQKSTAAPAASTAKSGTSSSTATLPAQGTAIILVQFQNDYTRRGGALYKSVKAVAEEQHVVWHTVDLVHRARQAGATIIHAPLNISDYQELACSTYGLLASVSESRALRKGSEGAQFCEYLIPEKGDIVLEGQRTVSAFDNTGLLDELHKRSISNLAVVGFTAQGTVESTLRRAYDEGLNVFALSDCVAATSKEAYQAAVQFTLPATAETVPYQHFLDLVIPADRKSVV